ncbi:MAG: hypothetical protein COB76_05610 [Alphaproteobacteria bacterium]|nr:MAG: hypothetical protein COB76_05610 [Alphaproteobacteria bacterium]
MGRSQKIIKTNSFAIYIKTLCRKVLAWLYTCALKKCDNGLYQALYCWERSNDLPSDVYVPTKKEWNDVLIRAQRAGRKILNLGKKRAAKLSAASYRRITKTL